MCFAGSGHRRVVTLGVPPAGLDPLLFSDYDQLRRFFYLFMFRDPAGLGEAAAAAGGMAFLDRLWADWSPGYHPGQHLARVKQSLRQPANLAAAIGYYRAADPLSMPRAPQGTTRQAAGPAPPPTLYLHGANDGCIAAELARSAAPLLPPQSRMIVIDGVGHFLHREKPREVNDHILAWVTS